MRIKFLNVSWKNFLSYGNYDTEIQLDKNQLTLIQGKNGGGKTSIIQSIHFALFGKALNKINKSALVNNKNKKGCVVRLKFSIANDIYLIERGIKPDILNVWKNDKLLDMNGDSRDFQSYLETNILKLNSKSFNRLICLGYDYVKFFELGAAERREFIESILDLTVLSKMSEKIKIMNKKDSDDIIQIGNLKSIKDNNLRIYSQQLDEAKQNTEENINDLNTQIDKLILENNEFQLDDIKFKKELDTQYDLKNEIEKLIEKDNKIINDYSKLLFAGQTRLKDTNKDLEFFEHNLTCPTCGRDIDKEYVNKQIDRLSINKNKLLNKINDIKIVVDTTNENISINKKALNVYQSKINELNNDISNINYRTNINLNRIKELKSNIDKIKSNNKLDELNKNVEDNKRESGELKVKLDKLTMNINNYKKCLYVLSETGVKKSIIDNYIEVINNLVNQYLVKFSFPFSFYMDNEFNETLLQDFRDPVTYANLSAGEKSRVDISLIITWNIIAGMRNSISTNLSSLDEIFDASLDDNDMFNLLNILKEQKDKNIFIISHKEVANMFDNIIFVNKEKFGFSSIEVK